MDHELSRVVDPLSAPPADRHLRSFRIVSLVVAGIIVSSGTNGAQDIPALGVPNEVHQILGDGVVGAAEPVRSLSDPLRIARAFANFCNRFSYVIPWRMMTTSIWGLQIE